MIFAVIGGDERQARLSAQLLSGGHLVRVFALEVAALPAGTYHCETAAEAVRGADCVVLPLPMEGARGYLNAPLAAEAHCIGEVLGVATAAQTVCAGMPGAEAVALAGRRGVTIEDYYAREELLAKNAVATAEGAIATLMGETAGTVWGSRALIIGRGRLGRALAPRLRGLGAELTVASRTPGDMAWARADGYAALDTRRLDGELEGFDVIINTVPSLVLTTSRLAELRPGALVIDLASKPGGVDMEAARMLGVRAVWALSLPGKWAPETAAQAVREAVCNILREKGYDLEAGT